ncbi:pleckstrin homology domain-containing family A member 6 isoform X2 [Diaphorina citri]|uniref:Pleckstrin homology domain-containing family A member 6 isoform X2 n=1 Tax=Diaphorina citri TaxID=121845 RepID=A0A1S3CXQ2_DIACI|nr:pleckstrin homology domain-containing family A member 6 isoform X2 [Diaphorina citri]
MEVALRPRLNGAPDVVRSTLSRTDPVKFSAETIDSLLGTPGKILIPERYIPESAPSMSREEKNKRLQKAEAIRKMLSESNLATCADEENEVELEKPSTLKKKMAEEKKQREHLLQLNQILAQQVMEKSKQVAGVNNSP